MLIQVIVKEGAYMIKKLTFVELVFLDTLVWMTISIMPTLVIGAVVGPSPAGSLNDWRNDWRAVFLMATTFVALNSVRPAIGFFVAPQRFSSNSFVFGMMGLIVAIGLYCFSLG